MEESFDSSQLQQLVETISNESFGQPFVHQASFNSRLRTTGGRYHLKSHNIDINPKVLSLHGLDELVGVIRHELCHYHLHLQGKGYQHRDESFKKLLIQTGGLRFVKPLEKEATIHFHIYQCDQCRAQIKRKRKINVQRYICGRCGGSLRLTNEK